MSINDKIEIHHSFQPSYCIDFQCLIKGNDEYSALCKTCKTNCKVLYGGQSDCLQYIDLKQCSLFKTSIKSRSSYILKFISFKISFIFK